MRTGETSRDYLWWEAITTSRTEGTTGVKYTPSPVKSELCSEAIFMEGQNYSQDIKAGKEERRNIPILLPLPRSFSSYEYPLLAGPNCRSSQGAWVMQSLEVNSWGTEQDRGRRRTERTNRQGWTTHQPCTGNSASISAYLRSGYF